MGCQHLRHLPYWLPHNASPWGIINILIKGTNIKYFNKVKKSCVLSNLGHICAFSCVHNILGTQPLQSAGRRKQNRGTLEERVLWFTCSRIKHHLRNIPCIGTYTREEELNMDELVCFKQSWSNLLLRREEPRFCEKTSSSDMAGTVWAFRIIGRNYVECCSESLVTNFYQSWGRSKDTFDRSWNSRTLLSFIGVKCQLGQKIKLRQQ